MEDFLHKHQNPVAADKVTTIQKDVSNGQGLAFLPECAAHVSGKLIVSLEYLLTWFALPISRLKGCCFGVSVPFFVLGVFLYWSGHWLCLDFLHLQVKPRQLQCNRHIFQCHPRLLSLIPQLHLLVKYSRCTTSLRCSRNLHCN